MGTLTINSQEYNLNQDLEQAFMRGSAWNNLFIPYKFEVTKLPMKSNAGQIVSLIQIYTFISTELNLFIGTHPNCKEAKDTLKQVNIERRKMIDYFESNYFALTDTSVIDGYNFFKGDTRVEI